MRRVQRGTLPGAEVWRMMCYKDKTFCSFFQLCKKGYSCHSALTDKIRADAKRAKLDILQFVEIPKECFVPFFMIDKDGK
jgi:hypothetical protein